MSDRILTRLTVRHAPECNHRKMEYKKVCQTEAKNVFQKAFDGISGLLIFSGNYYLQKI